MHLNSTAFSRAKCSLKQHILKCHAKAQAEYMYAVYTLKPETSLKELVKRLTNQHSSKIKKDNFARKLTR